MVCAMHIMASYEAWVKMFDNMHKSWQGDRLSSIVHNGVALGKSKESECNWSLFCAFNSAYWA